MSQEPLTNEQSANLNAIYDEICKSYHAIDDFRAKLLGLLPLATATGIFFLVDSPDPIRNETKVLVTFIGIFGFMITLGLFAYELYGINKCGGLIEAGQRLEEKMGFGKSEKDALLGSFNARRRALLGVINEPFAAAIIYPTVLAAWAFLASHFPSPQQAVRTALNVFLLFFFITLIYDLVLRRHELWEVLQNIRSKL